MINVISQSFGLDVVNINAYAKFYQNIPNGLRVIDIFHEQAGDKIFTNFSDKIKCLIIGHSMKRKKISNYQELIQSDPTSCPQNENGNN